ncbi:NADH-quinone oxidoreductase subunit NuoH [Desulfobacca acetoxidans]|uniref:NADH-quinone oxidoreductase subunit H n=1 Tax=Desulfobacca acetoxidans (strain ATCC 700848 / DSM 11109 / ASRB2) TaxID=880072 RepID=F2NHE9_DESAR|nr:NADH-quinone oxidoreductase subunit NuoH [Desulfobacca acetoxidans]AEB09065.1 NADH dehydrogenase (quinone) [Desulfobacca acetoxidans DSM 11109]
MQFLVAEGARLVVSLIGVIGLVSVNALFLIWMERKVSAHIQLRPGPMEVGFHGALQTIADALKLIGKELITPEDVDKIIYLLAPIVMFLPVLVSFLVIPFSPALVIRDINVGLLLIFAFGALSVLAILMAGWSSNNKYALLGAIRSVAQNVAYEIPLLITAMSIILMAGSFRLSDIVAQQSVLWNIFLQPLAFILYITCATAETNRAPFDIPEAESELVAGFHTEYSGMRFAIFFLAEYTNMFIVSAVATVLFLGGWRGPVLPPVVWFLIKVYLMIFIIMWFRWTFPRLRFDQLITFSWKVLIPLAFVNLLVTALVIKIL